MVVMLVLTTACAKHRFYNQLEVGDFTGAARTFEADSALWTDEEALYRAGVIYATPDSTLFDPWLAERSLVRLLVLHPETRYAPEAVALLGLIREVQELTGRVEEETQQRESLANEIAALRRQLEQLKAIDLERQPP